MTSVVVIEDSSDVGGALVDALGDDPDLTVVGLFASGEEALREIGRLDPDVVVVDHALPGLSGSEVSERLLRRFRRIRIVVLTRYVRGTVALTAFDAGASAVVVKSSDAGAVRRAVRTVASGGTYVDPLLAGRIVSLAVQQHATGSVDPRAAALQEDPA